VIEGTVNNVMDEGIVPSIRRRFINCEPSKTRWRIGRTSRSLHDDACSTSNLALQRIVSPYGHFVSSYEYWFLFIKRWQAECRIVIRRAWLRAPWTMWWMNVSCPQSAVANDRGLMADWTYI